MKHPADPFAGDRTKGEGDSSEDDANAIVTKALGDLTRDRRGTLQGDRDEAGATSPRSSSVSTRSR